MDDKVIVLPLSNPITAELDHLGVWHLSMFFGCVAIICALIWNYKNLSVWARFLWTYLLVSALYYYEFPIAHFGIYDTAFQVQAAEVFTEALIIPLGAIFFRKQILRILPLVVIGELICIWINHAGLLNAPSFDSLFCAMAIPLLPWWLIYAVVATALTHHGSTALLVIGAQLLALTVKKKHWLLLAGFAASVLILFTAAKANSHGFGFFDGESRLDTYKKFMQFWIDRPRWWALGVGPGSFLWASTLTNKMEGGMWVEGVWLQMHSDWLQIPWELGITGLVLLLAALVKSLKVAWNSTTQLALVFGCMAACTTYHPFRFFPTALLMSCIFYKLLYREPFKPELVLPETQPPRPEPLGKLLAIVIRHLGRSER